MAVKVPTDKDYWRYDGAYCKNLREQTPEDWRCPSCKRSKREIMRWTAREWPKGNKFYGWMAGLRHYYGWVEQPIICDQCHAAGVLAKRYYKDIIPSWFSFSPDEIGTFVTTKPHDRLVVHYHTALKIFEARFNRLVSHIQGQGELEGE